MVSSRIAFMVPKTREKAVGFVVVKLAAWQGLTNPLLSAKGKNTAAFVEELADAMRFL